MVFVLTKAYTILTAVVLIQFVHCNEMPEAW